MPTNTIPTREDARIRECIDALTQALRAKDINALMALYAPDIVTFDVRPPLQVRGVDGYKKNFEAWFASVQGPIDYEMRDLRITVGDDVAFCYGLGHVRGTRTTGERADYWVRVTSGFQRISGQWLISHEHVSAPIDMETMQAALDVQP